MKVVASGIDTLVIGFSIESYLDISSFEVLSDAKTKAAAKQFDAKGCGVEWFGAEFNMMARGAMGYEWVLRNGDVTVCIAREARGGSIMPEVYVTFSSQNMWANGAEKAVMTFKRWLSKWAVIRNTKVSRADLCVFPPSSRVSSFNPASRIKTTHRTFSMLEAILDPLVLAFKLSCI